MRGWTKSSELPTVENGIPMPRIEPRRWGKSRKTPVSAWPAFLKALRPGQSFVVAYPRLTVVLLWSRKLGIEVVKKDLPRQSGDWMRSARVWVVSNPHLQMGSLAAGATGPTDVQGSGLRQIQPPEGATR
jgi:hypothetical protein